MKTTTLLIEFLVIGFLSSIFLFLTYALSYSVDYNELWSIIIENKEYGAVALTLLFYALGALIHRAIEICFRKISTWISKNEDHSKIKMLNILQNGSANINNRLDYETSLMRMFASFSVLMPAIGIIYSLLACQSEDVHSGAFVLIVSLVIMFASFGCYYAQRNSIRLTVETFNEDYKTP